MHSGCCSDSSSLVPGYGDLSGFSFDSVWIWAFLILLLQHWSGLPVNLFTYSMLAYVKAYDPEQTFKKMQTQHMKNYILLCCTVTQICSERERERNITLIAAFSHKQTNKQAVLEPSAPWLPCHRTPGPFETTVCLLSISKWCSHCITHTHTHCPCVCQGVGLGPTA